MDHKPTFYVSGEPQNGSARVVSRTPLRADAHGRDNDEFVLYKDEFGAENGFGPIPKWAAIGEHARNNIWKGVRSVMLTTNDDLDPTFKTAIQKWPNWVQARVETDIMRTSQTVPINCCHWDWEPQLEAEEERRMASVSDIVETLHFAGFTKSVESIFNAHPITITSDLQNDKLVWRTVYQPNDNVVTR